MKKAGSILARSYLLIWLLLPNLVLLYVYNAAFSPLYVYLLVLALASLMYFYLFPSFKWFCLFNLPFAFISGFYAAFIFDYKSIPYAGMWFSVWDMVYLEFFDLGRYYTEVVVLNLCGFILYLVCILSLRKTEFAGNTLRKPVLLAGLLVILSGVLGQNFFSSRIDVASLDIGNAFTQSYPLGMAYQAYSTWTESRMQEKVGLTSIPDLERADAPIQGREIYILVIGETARSDRWLADLQFNDYAHIESENTVAFKDAFSQANFTDGSLYLMMTGASTYLEADNTATLPLVSKAADCETIWISNSKVYRYALQADSTVITEQTTSTPLVKRYDHAMLPSIYRAISQGGKRTCMIIHILGSHFSYHQRYSHEFMQKPVDIPDYEDRTSSGHVMALLNAYDNSIHATNDFLEQVIAAVKEQSATGLVLYTSDHGENIYDDDRELFQHIMANPSRYEIAVPFFIWASDQFKANYPDKWNNLVNNSNRPISNKQVMPTFVDLLGVRYEKDHFSPSLFSEYPLDQPRHVLAPDMRLLTEMEIE